MKTATLSLWLTMAAAALVATPVAGQPSVDVTFGRSLAPLDRYAMARRRPWPTRGK